MLEKPRFVFIKDEQFDHLPSTNPEGECYVRYSFAKEVFLKESRIQRIRSIKNICEYVQETLKKDNSQDYERLNDIQEKLDRILRAVNNTLSKV